MYRSDEDLELLTELAGVLDQTVTARGMTAGGYLILRELVRDPATRPVTGLAASLEAAPEEVAELAGRLVADGLAEARPDGVRASDAGRDHAEKVEAEANEAMRAYVMQRPHTATVYGLVASMQAGRFTVEDLLEFISEGSDDDADVE
jgi:hypothetical protein